MYGEKRGGDTCWWNEEVKEAVSRKKGHKAICLSSTEENKRRHKSMKNKAISKATREEAEEAPTELQSKKMGCLG